MNLMNIMNSFSINLRGGGIFLHKVFIFHIKIYNFIKFYYKNSPNLTNIFYYILSIYSNNVESFDDTID